MNRFATQAVLACCAVAVLALSPLAARAGTVNGVAVDLNGLRLPEITVTVTGGGVAVTNAGGAFTITTPNVRPVTLTLSGAGSQTVTVTNLDGTATHSLTIIVPALDQVPPCPCPVACAPCCERKHGFGFFRRR